MSDTPAELEKFNERLNEIDLRTRKAIGRLHTRIDRVIVILINDNEAAARHLDALND